MRNANYLLLKTQTILFNYVNLSYDPQMSMNVRQVWQDVNTNAETRMVAFSVFARLVTSLILIIGPVLVGIDFGLLQERKS